MIGVGLALLLIGVVTLFFMPWVGIPAAIVGIVLVVLFLLGFGTAPRRAASAARRSSGARSSARPAAVRSSQASSRRARRRHRGGAVGSDTRSADTRGGARGCLSALRRAVRAAAGVLPRVRG